MPVLRWHLRLPYAGWATATVLVGVVIMSIAACRGGGTDQPTSQGRQLYANNCATCHGVRGEGAPDWHIERPDGCLPPPPHDSTGHSWHHGDGLLFQIVKGGGASLKIPQFKSCMPAFGDRLSDDEVRVIIAHLKTLWGSQEREFQAEVSRQDPFP